MSVSLPSITALKYLAQNISIYYFGTYRFLTLSHCCDLKYILLRSNKIPTIFLDYLYLAANFETPLNIYYLPHYRSVDLAGSCKIFHEKAVTSISEIFFCRITHGARKLL